MPPSPIVEPPNPSPETPVEPPAEPSPEPSPVPSPQPSPMPSPTPSPPVCVVPTIIPACSTRTGLCSATTCEANSIESTIVDCTVGKATAACLPWSCVIPGACIPTTTQSCLGNLTCTGKGCEASPLIGSPCLVPACAPEPSPAAPSPRVVHKPSYKPVYTATYKPTKKAGRWSKAKSSAHLTPAPVYTYSTPSADSYNQPVYVTPIAAYSSGRRLRGGKAWHVATPAVTYSSVLPTHASYSSTPSAYSYTPSPVPAKSCGFYVCGCPPEGDSGPTRPGPVPVTVVPIPATLTPIEPLNTTAVTDVSVNASASAMAVAALP